MKRLSLTELKAKQAELTKKIAAAEEREKNIIGAYMQELTGEVELSGVKKWLDEHAILDDPSGEVKENDGDGTLHRKASLAI